MMSASGTRTTITEITFHLRLERTLVSLNYHSWILERFITNQYFLKEPVSSQAVYQKDIAKLPPTGRPITASTVNSRNRESVRMYSSV